MNPRSNHKNASFSSSGLSFRQNVCTCMVSVGFLVDISGITSRHDEVQFVLFYALKIFQILLGNNFRSKLRVQLIDEGVFELQFLKY